MSKTNNKIISVQEIVFDELKRLSDDNIMNGDGARSEIARSNVISNNAQTFIKVVNLSLRIKELAKRSETQEKKLLQELDIVDED